MATGPTRGADWPELRLVTRDWPPYHIVENGQISGPAVTVVRCAVSRMGVTMRLEAFPWARAQMMVQQGQADGFFTASQTPDRDVWAVLSGPVTWSTIVWYLPRDSTKDPTQDKNLPVASMRGSAFGDYLDRNHYTNITKLGAVSDVLRLLLKGRVDAVLLTEATADDAFRTILTPSDREKLRLIPVSKHPLGVYFARSFLERAPGFLDAFNSATAQCLGEQPDLGTSMIAH